MNEEEYGQDWNEAFEPQIDAMNRAIQPEEFLAIHVDMGGLGVVSQNLYEILRTKNTDNPYEIAAEMAYAPVWQAYFGSLKAEADAVAADARRTFDEWYALAYDIAKRYLNSEKEPGEKIIATDIKNTIPWLLAEDGEWEVTNADGRVDTVTLSSYKDVLNAKRDAEKRASLMETYVKAIQSKINLLPSQLALARRGMDNTYQSVPEDGVNGPNYTENEDDE